MLLPAAKKQQIFITLCTWHLLQYCMTGAYARHNQRISRYRTSTLGRTASIDIKDKILEWQSLATCEHLRFEAKQTCQTECERKLITAPRHGHCPRSIHLLYCLNNCSYDHDCPGVEKCCSSHCGMVCTEPTGLSQDNSLPPIPKILQYRYIHGNLVELTIQTWANSSFICHVEVRYHYGTVFSERLLGPWQWQPVEKTYESSDTRIKITNISFKVKTGRYYQVRVAAINENGFRGYSEPSQVFTARNEPKPPKEPIDLKLISAQRDGKYFKMKISWCPSKSNLPVEKYKIIWSLYIDSKEGSLISNEAYVKDSHQFEIRNLLPDSSYYVQVQAMSINGDRRLKSQKVQRLFNTTEEITKAPFIPLKCTPKSRQRQKHGRNNNINHNNSIEKYNRIDSNFSEGKDNFGIASTTIPLNIVSSATPTALALTGNETTSYKVRYRFNRKLGMITQISGLQPFREKVYELCQIETNCEQREYSAIRVKKDSLEFSKLKFESTYVLKAYNMDGDGYDSKSTITFTTPKCENFRKSFPKAQIKC